MSCNWFNKRKSQKGRSAKPGSAASSLSAKPSRESIYAFLMLSYVRLSAKRFTISTVLRAGVFWVAGKPEVLINQSLSPTFTATSPAPAVSISTNFLLIKKIMTWVTTIK